MTPPNGETGADDTVGENPVTDGAARQRVVNASVTLGAAVGITALSFGLAAVSAGASVWQACA
ncbi:MAG: hypothetical protein ACKOIZ_00545, partial [Actinomycetota bacterium]